MDLDPETSMAFEMAWIMIQPREKSCLRPAPDGSQDFHYIHTEFRKIWPSSVIHSFLPQDPSQNLDIISISTNQNSSQSSCYFEELKEARGFRWLSVGPASNLGILANFMFSESSDTKEKEVIWMDVGYESTEVLMEQASASIYMTFSSILWKQALIIVSISNPTWHAYLVCY